MSRLPKPRSTVDAYNENDNSSPDAQWSGWRGEPISRGAAAGGASSALGMADREGCGGRRLRRFVAALCLAAATSSTSAAAIEPIAKDQFIEFQADELTYDSRNKITRAIGNVEAVQAGRRVVADTVVYDELRDVVTAEGNVTLYEPTGEVISARSLEVTGDLKTGVIEDMRAVLADGARLSAERGERRDGTITTAKNATYTPCLPCADDPTRAPLWQVRAAKVVHNQDQRIVEFSHSWLDISGVPGRLRSVLLSAGPVGQAQERAADPRLREVVGSRIHRPGALLHRPFELTGHDDHAVGDDQRRSGAARAVSPGAAARQDRRRRQCDLRLAWPLSRTRARRIALRLQPRLARRPRPTTSLRADVPSSVRYQQPAHHDLPTIRRALRGFPELSRR